MNEKKTITQHVKDWWRENGAAVKTGFYCGVLGVVYGMYVGHVGTSEMYLRYGLERAHKDSDYPEDEFGLTEANCDDPEMAEIVAFENETA